MTNAATALGRAAARLDPISLSEVLEAAALQARTDRKYLIAPARFDQLIGSCGPGLRVLDIDDRRVFRYESTYFDTPDLVSYHRSVTGRRNRFKVRTRSYLDSGLCMLEVKTTGGRGDVVKERMTYPCARSDVLDDEAKGFVAQRTRWSGTVDALAPVLRTRYLRMTLVDPDAGVRITCDARLRFSDPGASRATCMDTHVLVETKSVGGVTAADRALWSMAERPLPMSKFGIGLALIRPGLPANRWNRTLRRHFVWEPARPSITR